MKTITMTQKSILTMLLFIWFLWEQLQSYFRIILPTLRTNTAILATSSVIFGTNTIIMRTNMAMLVSIMVRLRTKIGLFL